MSVCSDGCVCVPFEYFPILISLIFDRHRCHRRRLLNSRRNKSDRKTASRSDRKPFAFYWIGRSKPTKCSLRMHVNLGWIPSCFFRASTNATSVRCFVVAAHFRLCSTLHGYRFCYRVVYKKQFGLFGVFFHSFFQCKPFDPVFISFR